jgi:CheY-like chemotaxis protein
MQSINRPRVLYADDNEDACLMISTLLAFSNIETTSAHTIDEALRLARAELFDLYLLDTQFPEGSGLELCRQLRQSNPSIPIIFYSGNAYEADKAKGFAAGAAAYLVKPNSEGIAPAIFQLAKSRTAIS